MQLVLELKAGKEIPEGSRLEFLEWISWNKFALLSGPLSRWGIADLPLFKTLSVIHSSR